MNNIVHRSDLLVQRDIMLEAYGSIEEAIKDESFELPEPEEAVFLISDHGKLYELNLVGAFIWEKLQTDLSIEKIADAICECFDVSKDVAARDLEGFLRFLNKISLLAVK